jgi:hypothetical protein
VAPFRTAVEPSWTSVADSPPAVSIVTVRPYLGTLPANDTVPDAGATTGVPDRAPMSIPRCWPAAYGSPPNENGRSTGPSTGHVQACPAGTTISAAKIAASSARRIGETPPVVVLLSAG